MVRLFVVSSLCFWLCWVETCKIGICNLKSHTALEGFCDMSDVELYGFLFIKNVFGCVYNVLLETFVFLFKRMGFTYSMICLIILGFNPLVM
jgi:hypothetical protein